MGCEALLQSTIQQAEALTREAFNHFCTSNLERLQSAAIYDPIETDAERDPER
jgi:hypothetical protein